MREDPRRLTTCLGPGAGEERLTFSGMRALLVPVKSFEDAKLRLAPVLSLSDRRHLARELASGVIRAAAGLPSFVVCDDHDVASFSEALGATVIWTPGLGLSGAVTEGVARLASSGFESAVVAHSDLPRPEGISRVGAESPPDVITIVPDRRRDGSNVIALPCAAGFRFSYGRGSFARHCDEAARCRLELRVLHDHDLSDDVDVPGDLALLS